LEKRERGRIHGLSKFFGYPLLSQDQVKLRTSNFVGTFIVSIRTKAHENVGNSGRGRSQSPENFQGANRAHCAVIFAIAQLSCINFYHRIQRADSYMHKLLLAVDEDNFNNVGYLKISSTPWLPLYRIGSSVVSFRWWITCRKTRVSFVRSHSNLLHVTES